MRPSQQLFDLSIADLRRSGDEVAANALEALRDGSDTVARRSWLREQVRQRLNSLKAQAASDERIRLGLLTSAHIRLLKRIRALEAVAAELRAEATPAAGPSQEPV